MAVVIYRKGDTHTVNGIKCEAKRVSHKFFSGEPEPGWFFSPEEAYMEVVNDVQEEEQAEEVEEIKEEIHVDEKEAEKESMVIEGMDNDEIRLAAKNAGISTYNTSRIRTLKEKLKNV